MSVLEAVVGGIRTQVAMPGTAEWTTLQEAEEQLWCTEYDIPPKEYAAKYDQYHPRRILFGVGIDAQLVGISSLLLPHSDAQTIQEAGFLTVHAAEAKTDAEGTPGWGKLNISDKGWERLNEFDAKVVLDALTHVVRPEYRVGHPRFNLLLQTMQYWFTLAMFELRVQNITQPQKIENGPAILTCMVRTLLQPMVRHYNFYPKTTGSPTLGVELLGAECDYGATKDDERVTTVIVPINKLLKADTLNHRRPLIDLSIFRQAHPNIRTPFINKYLGGN